MNKPSQSKPSSPARDPVDEFHDHLSRCPRCERNIFDLCPEGQKIMERMSSGILKCCGFGKEPK